MTNEKFRGNRKNNLEKLEEVSRDGEVTHEKEPSYNYSYFQVRNWGTLVTSVTVTTIKSCSCNLVPDTVPKS